MRHLTRLCAAGLPAAALVPFFLPGDRPSAPLTDPAQPAATPWRAEIHVEVARADLETYALLADEIVLARVTGRTPVLSRQRGLGHTSTTLDVLDALKGSPAETIAVNVPGGTDGIGVVVVDAAPQLAVGDEVVLFLQRTESGERGILGLRSGTYRVHETTTGGRTVTGLHAPNQALASFVDEVRTLAGVTNDGEEVSR